MTLVLWLVGLFLAVVWLGVVFIGPPYVPCIVFDIKENKLALVDLETCDFALYHQSRVCVIERLVDERYRVRNTNGQVFHTFSSPRYKTHNRRR